MAGGSDLVHEVRKIWEHLLEMGIGAVFGNDIG